MKNEGDDLSTFYSVVVRFTTSLTEAPSNSTFKIVYYIVAVIFIIDIFAYIMFCRNFSISSIASKFRVLNFAFSTLVYLIPVLVNMAYNFKQQSILVTFSFFDQHTGSIIILVLIAIIRLWQTPLLFSTPFFGKSSIPSAAIPNYHSSVIVVLFLFGCCLSLASCSKISAIYCSIFLFIHGIISAFVMWWYPFASNFWTACYIAIWATEPINSILTFSSLIFEDFFSGLIILLIGSFCVVGAFFIFYYCLNVRNKRIIQMLEKQIIALKTYEIKLIFQVAICEGKLTKQVASFLKAEFQNSTEVEILIALTYTLLHNNIEDKEIPNYIWVLAHVHPISWTKRFIIFKIYQKFTTSTDYVSIIPSSDEIDRQIQAYNYLTDQFWSLMLQGQINKAIEITEQLHYQLNDLNNKYKSLKSFYPNHPKILQLNSDFFKNDPIENPENQMINDITTNIKANVQKKTPFLFFFFIFATFAMNAYYIYYTCYYYIDLLALLGELTNFPISLNQTLEISFDWLSSIYSITNSMNCTKYVNLNCEDIYQIMGSKIVPECHSVKYYLKNIRPVYTSIQFYLNNIAKIFNNLQANTGLKGVNWFGRSIDLYQTLDNITEFKLDFHSVIMYQTSQILSHSDGNNTDLCNLDFVNYVRSNVAFYLNLTDQMVDQLLSIIDSTKNVTQSYKNNDFFGLSISQDIKRTMLFLVFLLLSSILLYTCVFTISSIYTKHFRPSEHPNHEYREVQLSKETEYFTLFPKLLVRFLYINIIYFILFFVQYVIVNHYIRYWFNAMLDEIILTTTVQRLSIQACELANHGFRAWQFKGTEEYFLASLLEFRNAFASSVLEMFPYLLPKSDDIPPSLKYQSIPNNVTRISELFSRWPVLSIMRLYFYYNLFYEEFNYSKISELDVTTHQLFMTYLRNNLTSLSQDLIDLSLKSCEYSIYLTSFEQFISTIYIGLCVIFLIYLFLKLHDMWISIQERFIDLSPLFIVKHKCIMNFVIESEDARADDKESQSYFTLFEAANIALIALDKNLVILGFTRIVQTMFGYKYEQLIGQHIEILIPKSSQYAKNNDAKFYQQISLIENGELDSSFTRSLVGRCSDNTSIHLRATVNLTSYNGRDYYLIEFRSVTDELEFEDLIISHRDLINEFLRSSMPIPLFPDLTRSHGPVSKTFARSALVYLGVYLDCNDYNNIYHLVDLKKKVEFVLPFFDGSDNACVLYVSCSSCILLFVNQKEDETHLVNALNFAFSYIQNNAEPVYGILVDEEESTVVAFPSPDVPDQYQNCAMPIEEAQSHVPKMTIEPMIKGIDRVLEGLKYVKPNTLIVSDSYLPLLQDFTVVPIESDLDIHISYIYSPENQFSSNNSEEEMEEEESTLDY